MQPYRDNKYKNRPFLGTPLGGDLKRPSWRRPSRKIRVQKTRHILPLSPVPEPASPLHEALPQRTLVTSPLPTMPVPVSPPYESHRTPVTSLRSPPCPTGVPSHGSSARRAPHVCRHILRLPAVPWPASPPREAVPHRPPVTPCCCPPCPGLPLLHIRSAKWVTDNFPHPCWSSTPRRDLSTSKLPFLALLLPPAGLLAGKVLRVAGGPLWPVVGGGGGCSLGACVG